MQFDHIYLDPPWDRGAYSGLDGAARFYRVMSISDMASLRVADLAAKRCNMHMWSGGFAVSDAMQLIARFRRTGEPDGQVFFYKGIECVWVKLCEGRARWKLYKLVKAMLDLGLVGFLDWIAVKNPGSYFSNNIEMVFLATTHKGILPTKKMTPQLLFHPRTKRHSRKPGQVRSKIERMYPGQRYVELFATETCPGWASLGLEIDGRLLEDSIPWLLQQEQLPPYQDETAADEIRKKQTVESKSDPRPRTGNYFSNK